MLRAEIDKFQTDPCRTALMFRRLGGEDDGSWILTCPGCGFAFRPVKGLFPQAIINHLELYSIGGKMTLTDGMLTGWSELRIKSCSVNQ